MPRKKNEAVEKPELKEEVAAPAAEEKAARSPNAWINHVPASFFSREEDGNLKVIHMPGKPAQGDQPERPARDFVRANLRDEKGPYSVLFETKNVITPKDDKGVPKLGERNIRGFEGQNMVISRPTGEKDENGKEIWERGTKPFMEIKSERDAARSAYFEAQRAAAKAAPDKAAPAAEAEMQAE